MIIRGFDVVKTYQLYFFPYIFLVTNGYRWLLKVTSLSEALVWSKQGSFISALISLWIQVVTGWLLKVISLSEALMQSKQQLYFDPYISLVTYRYRWLHAGYSRLWIYQTLNCQTKQLYFSPYISLVTHGYSMVTQGYVSISGFDVVKTDQLYFFSYISLVTHGYK